jgi:hypothetical protein
MLSPGFQRPSHSAERRVVARDGAAKAYRMTIKRIFLGALAMLAAGALLAAMIALETAFYLHSLLE